ncbi:MAG: ChaN family lipoprotein [Candidatus Sericytochromatia bacterium]|uniref:ChaN family lipoprotein n=1 Tax=Candidatus Tanganyikabacteria bacterium TaxID=2961651 RepID=A0A938BM93_9BACT|nr:ChaN family lipoprotein [Candidatus Tanganyikabacteria bacterium]
MIRQGVLLGVMSVLAGCGAGYQAIAAGPDASATSSARATARQAPAGFLGAFSSGGDALTWTQALSALARADVAYIGEFHDDPATHEFELATLKALAGAGRPVALSLEMFETDVQQTLDAYLAGSIGEAEFLASARPWPNYKTDYRPLVEYAKAAGIPVVAANVPRRLASLVAKGGLAAMAGQPDSEKRWSHIPESCPADAYWKEFEKVAAHPGMPPGAVWKWYEAQCLKDETMARSIGLALASRKVLHVNGAFHSDRGLGTPARVGKWRPGVSEAIATVRPVASVPPALPPDLAGVADSVIFVKGPAHGGPAPDRI